MKSLQVLVIIAVCSFIVSCSPKQQIQAEGADKDSKGCLASAGYRWSNLKKECIRIFELPIQLSNPDNSFSAGVIISEDGKQAEVMTKDGDFILDKKSDDNYLNESSNAGVFLKKTNGKWEFGKIKGEIVEYTEIVK